MQANDLFEYRDKNIKAFRDGTFLSAYDYALKDVKDFSQEIKSMEERMNLSLFEDIFGLPSPADYAKKLISIRNADEKKIVAEI